MQDYMYYLSGKLEYKRVNAGRESVRPRERKEEGERRFVSGGIAGSASHQVGLSLLGWFGVA